jgi:DNA-binding NtrC family response regulator
MTILYVDDDPDDCEIMIEAIAKLDQSINVITFAGVAEAIEFLDQVSVPPNFIFLDINMPLVNGKTGLIEIKKRDKLKNIPVVMCSTTPVTREMKTYFELGAYDFIVKPNTFDKLCVALDSILHSVDNS